MQNFYVISNNMVKFYFNNDIPLFAWKPDSSHNIIISIGVICKLVAAALAITLHMLIILEVNTAEAGRK